MLDTLQFEIYLKIASFLDVKSLWNLLQSSPIFWRNTICPEVSWLEYIIENYIKQKQLTILSKFDSQYYKLKYLTMNSDIEKQNGVRFFSSSEHPNIGRITSSHNGAKMIVSEKSTADQEIICMTFKVFENTAIEIAVLDSAFIVNDQNGNFAHRNATIGIASKKTFGSNLSTYTSFTTGCVVQVILTKSKFTCIIRHNEGVLIRKIANEIYVDTPYDGSMYFKFSEIIPNSDRNYRIGITSWKNFDIGLFNYTYAMDNEEAPATDPNLQVDHIPHIIPFLPNGNNIVLTLNIPIGQNLTPNAIALLQQQLNVAIQLAQGAFINQ